jgi:A/G-specific adenine glycosylase
MERQPPETDSESRGLQSAFSAPLLAWYRASCRRLPWRGATDPYAILVSEVMLQQTQVRTVIPYYARWMERFPTLGALAQADEAEVLKAWEGLGYYRRARLLHAAAQMVVSEFGGRFPSDPEAIAALPGVGPYTLAAIASIAFGHAMPVVDGNVIRAITRRFGIRGVPSRLPARREIAETVRCLIPREAPGDFNQALMELGATVCLPRRPCCLLCPVREGCVAYAEGAQAKLPEAAPRKAVVREFEYAGLVVRDGKALLCQRGEGGRMERLWQFPSVLLPRESKRWTARWRARYGALRSAEPLATLNYSVTNHRIRLELHRIEGFQRYKLPSAHWVPLAEVPRLAFTAAHRKLADRFLAAG